MFEEIWGVDWNAVVGRQYQCPPDNPPKGGTLTAITIRSGAVPSECFATIEFIGGPLICDGWTFTDA
jgi:hypothetical protein